MRNALVLLFAFIFYIPTATAGWFAEIIKIGNELNPLLKPPDTVIEPLKKSELSDYPPHYKFYRVKEPIFDSSLFFLEAGSKNKPTVILIHGIGEFASKDWLSTLPALEKNFHVYAIDLPGFGLSTGRNFEYSPLQYSKILNWFIGEYTTDKPTLVGHSMGAAVSLYFASIYSEQINLLVLVDAAGILEPISYAKQLSSFSELSGALPRTLQRITSRVNNFSDVLIEKSDFLYRSFEKVKRTNLLRQSSLSKQSDINAALGLLTTNFSLLDFTKVVPTQIIWGDKDRIAPIRTGYALIAKLPQAQLHQIANAEHVPMKTHSIEFNRTLLNVIKNKPKTSPSVIEINDTQIKNQNMQPRTAYCKDDNITQFSGYYDVISIDNCKLPVLNGVISNKFSARNSIVNVSNSLLGNGNTPIVIDRSSITATASTFYGNIKSYRSRFDFAAVNLKSEIPVLTSSESTIITASLSKMIGAKHKTNIHGHYQLKNNSLLDVLVKN